MWSGGFYLIMCQIVISFTRPEVSSKDFQVCPQFQIYQKCFWWKGKFQLLNAVKLNIYFMPSCLFLKDKDSLLHWSMKKIPSLSLSHSLSISNTTPLYSGRILRPSRILPWSSRNLPPLLTKYWNFGDFFISKIKKYEI